MQGTERLPVETTWHHQAPGLSGGKEAWNTSGHSSLKGTSVQGGLGQAPPSYLTQLSALPSGRQLVWKTLGIRSSPVLLFDHSPWQPLRW